MTWRTIDTAAPVSPEESFLLWVPDLADERNGPWLVGYCAGGDWFSGLLPDVPVNPSHWWDGGLPAGPTP